MLESHWEVPFSGWDVSDWIEPRREDYQPRPFTGGVATFNTSTAHGLVVGEKITLYGFTDPTFNGVGTAFTVFVSIQPQLDYVYRNGSRSKLWISC